MKSIIGRLRVFICFFIMGLFPINGYAQISLTNSEQNIGNYSGVNISLGDVDNDMDIDVLVANAHKAPGPTEPAHPNKLYLNDGNGILTDSNQDMDIAPTSSVYFCDIDNDDDLDALIFNGTRISGMGIPNLIKINDGNGNFIDS